MRICALAVLLAFAASAQQQQQKSPPSARPRTDKPQQQEPDETPPRPTGDKEQPPEDDLQKLKWDMAEQAPVVTHHQLGKLHYTATAGRMPIKDPAGGIEAEMFFVAYTQDGAAPASRPVTFAFNGGPGSASIWLHMGAVGPQKVVLEKDGWLPQSPYRLTENAASPLDKTDLVLIDAIGTGFSRPADMKKAKKFWGLKGDSHAFGEFIRMYLTRNQRWSSPLFLLGESYGTTRAAEVAGFLADRGIFFKGIILLSMVLDFETLETSRNNDLAFVLTLPTYSMIAQFHHRLPQPVKQDEVVRWALSDYAALLARGDSLSGQERQNAIAQIARYTGLRPEIIDLANLRIDVQLFTKWLLADQKLLVGRLDGRYTGAPPQQFFGRGFYDPAMNSIAAPITSVFNDYVRSTLGYATDLPYYTSADQLSTSPDFEFWRKWEWGNAIEGFPDTATSLRAAMVKNPYLKVLVMEGVYDLATPFAAADYTMNHLNLPLQLRRNVSIASYDSGHMVYVRDNMLAKFHDDVAAFIDGR